jgi:hypothetical protein
MRPTPPPILRRRARLRAYKELFPKVCERIAALNLDDQALEALLTRPQPRLHNQSIRQCLTPAGIRPLWVQLNCVLRESIQCSTVDT